MVDIPLLAAALAVLSCALLYGAVVPSLARRRAVAKRLGDYLPEAVVGSQLRKPLDPHGRISLGLVTRPLKRAAGGGRLALFLPALAGLGVGVALQDPILGAAAALQTVAFATLWGHDLADRRRRLFVDQTLPTVLRMSASLRAGGSLLQAMQGVAREGLFPTANEFRRALDEVGMGFSLDEALDRLADRIGTEDYAALAISLAVQRRVGGNAALVLDTLAESAQARVELSQQIEVLTAQQRLSSWILVLLPLVVALLFFVADREFLAPLVSTLPGRLMVLTAAALQAMGSWALRKVGGVSL